MPSRFSANTDGFISEFMSPDTIRNWGGPGMQTPARLGSGLQKISRSAVNYFYGAVGVTGTITKYAFGGIGG
jgi:hypothetical protein